MNKISLSEAVSFLKKWNFWEQEENSGIFHQYFMGYWIDLFEEPNTLYEENSNEIVYKPNWFTKFIIRRHVKKLSEKLKDCYRYIYRCHLCYTLCRSDKKFTKEEQKNVKCSACSLGISDEGQKYFEKIELEKRQIELIKQAMQELEEEKKSLTN